jgi:hypothetical protein
MACQNFTTVTVKKEIGSLDFMFVGRERVGKGYAQKSPVTFAGSWKFTMLSGLVKDWTQSRYQRKGNAFVR